MNLAGRDVVILGEESIIRNAFSKPNLTDRCDVVMFRLFSSGNNGLVGSSGSLWHENRRFTIKALREFGLGSAPKLNATILQEVLKICEMVRRNENEPEDLRLPINVAVLNIIWKLTAGSGKQFEHDSCELHGFLERLSFLTEDVLSMGPFQIFPSLVWFWSPVRRAYQRFVLGVSQGRRFEKSSGFIPFATIAKEVEKHKQSLEGKAPRDYIDAYLQQMEELAKRGESNPNFTELQLWANVSDLFFAGSETTTNGIHWCILFLLRHPDKQERLQSEVDQVVGKDRLPSLDDRQQTHCRQRVKKTGGGSPLPPLSPETEKTFDALGGNIAMQLSNPFDDNGLNVGVAENQEITAQMAEESLEGSMTDHDNRDEPSTPNEARTRRAQIIEKVLKGNRRASQGRKEQKRKTERVTAAEEVLVAHEKEKHQLLMEIRSQE
ncbi:unnamed protein product, partial [Darwinula stevensoni]